METGIVIIAQRACRAFPGSNMISPCSGGVIKNVTVKSVAEAIALSQNLLANNTSIQVYAHTRGYRAPNGFSAAKWEICGDNVV